MRDSGIVNQTNEMEQQFFQHLRQFKTKYSVSKKVAFMLSGWAEFAVNIAGTVKLLIASLMNFCKEL